jgi:hypothetical protein
MIQNYSRVMCDGRVVGSFNTAHGDKSPHAQAADLAVATALQSGFPAFVEAWTYNAAMASWVLTVQYEVTVKRIAPFDTYVKNEEG